MPTFIKNFSEISIRDLALVGGKNASLGEMFCQLTPKGILVPDGFAVTSEAYGVFLDENHLRKPLDDLLAQVDKPQFSNLQSHPPPWLPQWRAQDPTYCPPQSAPQD